MDFQPDIIDLGMGNPDFDLLPIELLRRSAEVYFATGDRRSLQYGVEQGDGYFRKALAEFLVGVYGFIVDPDLLFITSGASSALDLLCSLYTHPGETIFVEEPSYFLALRIFEDHGLQVLPIPMDGDGLIIEVLEERLQEVHPRFIYTIPVFQNPSGRTLSEARRVELVDLAKQHDFLILADEVYQFLPYGRKPPDPLAKYSEKVEQVISINSFSKILAPGLRLGWIQAHKQVINRLSGSGLLESGGGMSPFTSAQILGLIQSGQLHANIINLQKEYATRLGIMDSALHEKIPQAEYEKPQGGFFFWVHFPGLEAKALRPIVNRYKVDFREGGLFSSEGGLQDFLRLSFCFYNQEGILTGIDRLATCLKDRSQS